MGSRPTQGHRQQQQAHQEQHHTQVQHTQVSTPCRAAGGWQRAMRAC
jgi:hypothetical protein